MINLGDFDEDLVITSNDLVFLQAHINNVPGYELDDDYVLNLAMRNPNYIIGVSDVNQMALDFLAGSLVKRSGYTLTLTEPEPEPQHIANFILNDQNQIIYTGYGFVTGVYFVFDKEPDNITLHGLSGWYTDGFVDGSSVYRLLVWSNTENPFSNNEGVFLYFNENYNGQLLYIESCTAFLNGLSADVTEMLPVAAEEPGGLPPMPDPPDENDGLTSF